MSASCQVTVSPGGGGGPYAFSDGGPVKRCWLYREPCLAMYSVLKDISLRGVEVGCLGLG